MDVREVLYTTRAMRRVRPDPIPPDVQARILDAAIRAPSGGNAQTWRFLLVDDHEVIGRLAGLYRDAIERLWSGGSYRARLEAVEADPDSEQSIQYAKIVRSSRHLADHFDSVPLLLFGFSPAPLVPGSIYPAIWSAQLAARAEGVGSALTSVLGTFHGAETTEILGVPDDGSWVMACCATFGYPIGRWGVARRIPVHEVAYRNRWGDPLGFEVPEPLWPEAAPG